MRPRALVSSLPAPFDDCVVIGFARVRPAAFAELTKAEVEVAEGLLAGSTLKAIARARRVSVRTVEHQVERVYRKLRVTSRFELVARMARAD